MQLLDLVATHANRHARKKKIVSDETQQKRKQQLMQCFTELRGLGYRIEDVTNLRETHVRALVKHWEETGKSASTIQNRLTTLRVFSSWIGKHGMVREAEHYASSRESVRRQSSARYDKSWSARAIDAMSLIEHVCAEDPYVGIQLKLALAFGLRRKEAVMFKPFRNHVGQAVLLDAQSGTKGGKARVIPITDEMQLAILNEAKHIAKYAEGHVGDPNRSLQQNLRRFYLITGKFGITRKDLGVTAHGLRHQFLNDYYERITGRPSPVRADLLQHPTGPAIAPLDGIDKLAQIQTSAVAGHVRPQIVTAYTGSQHVLEKERRERNQARLATLLQLANKTPEEERETTALLKQLANEK